MEKIGAKHNEDKDQQRVHSRDGLMFEKTAQRNIKAPEIHRRQCLKYLWGEINK